MVVPLDTMVEERWLRYAREIGLAVLLAKVRQCSVTVQVLLKTYTDGIAYLDPLDGLWGIQSTLEQEGSQFERTAPGKNLWGQLLEGVRIRIQTEDRGKKGVSVGPVDGGLRNSFGG